MTAAELSESFSGVKGQPSMPSAATQQETASEETRQRERLVIPADSPLKLLFCQDKTC